jgi:hypothetical protein
MTSLTRTFSIRQGSLGLLCAALVSSMLAGVAAAQTPPPAETPPSQPPAAAAPDPPQAETAATREKSAKDAADPCHVFAPADEKPLDQYRREIFETICGTAARFDRLFGNRRFDEEARRTHGRVGVRALYDEHDGMEVDGKFRINVDFPNLDHRVKAFLGREDRDDFVRGNDQELDFLPTFFEREGGAEWLVGFGYSPARGDRTRSDIDAGIEGTDPFVRARYRYYRVAGDRNLFRARQTVYWTNEKDFGTATRFDFERPIGQRSLARWNANATYDGETRGIDWNSGVTLYRGFSSDRAIAWYVGIDGETGREVSLENYGTTVTYRQKLFRPWFFGELISGVTWPRDSWDEEREAAFHVGFGFEIQFSGDAFQRGGSNGAPAAP